MTVWRQVRLPPSLLREAEPADGGGQGIFRLLIGESQAERPTGAAVGTEIAKKSKENRKVDCSAQRTVGFSAFVCY